MENLETGKVSIVVPVYNQEKYLDISLPSLLNQTYKNLEIIMINDGSFDSSESIIQKYLEKDNRIKLINKKNGGLVDACICGVKNATGEYLCFVDPDDRISHNFVENFLQYMELDCDFISMGIYYESDKIIPYTLESNKTYIKDELIKLRNEYIANKSKLAISNKLFVSRWNKLYRTSCVKKFINQFEKCKGVSLGEDSIFTFLLLTYANKGKTISKCNGYYYNVANPNSMMKQINIDNHLAKCETAFNSFVSLIEEVKGPRLLAYDLYFLLINGLFNKLRDNDEKLFDSLYVKLSNSNIYEKSIKYIFKQTNSLKLKFDLFLRINCKNSKKYLSYHNTIKRFIKLIGR